MALTAPTKKNMLRAPYMSHKVPPAAGPTAYATLTTVFCIPAILALWCGILEVISAMYAPVPAPAAKPPVPTSI